MTLVGGAANAQSLETRRAHVHLPAQTLDKSLRMVAALYKVDLLFTADTVAGKRAPKLIGRYSLDQSLRYLLEAHGLTVRHAGGATFAVVRKAPEALSGETAAVPEILVIGRRTQNLDAQRTERSAQPHLVINRQEIAAATPATVEMLLRDKVPSNSLSASFAQTPGASLGRTRSQVNLRGLGENATLVLIDGKRMPGIPDPGFVLGQPDLNALLPEMIDRVEVVAAAGGGIYGPSAASGTVNLVLDRRKEGMDGTMSFGISQSGDADTARIGVRAGITSSEGDSSVSFAYGAAKIARLSFGDRPYSALAAANALNVLLPTSPSINILSISGNLVLKTGEDLGAPISFIPPNATADAALVANAGHLDLRLAPTRLGERRTLVSGQRTRSIMLSARHRFSSDIEIYGDLIDLRNDGSARFGLGDGAYTISPDNPASPFAQTVAISFSLPDAGIDAQSATAARRISMGLIAPLGGGWRVVADQNFGTGRQSLRGKGLGPNDALALAIGLGASADRPAPAPFGPRETFDTAAAQYLVPQIYDFRQTNRFSDIVIKSSGPIWHAASGPATLALSLEHRQENVRPGRSKTSSPNLPVAVDASGYRQTIRSAALELGLPVLGQTPSPLIDLQLALRYDSSGFRVPQERFANASKQSSTRRDTLLYTAGARLRPTPWFMLRSSAAIGQVPPQPYQLIASTSTVDGPSFWDDPLRGGTPLGSEKPFDLVELGSLDLSAERFATISLGLVVDFETSRGLFFSIDATRLRRRNEISEAVSGNIGYFLANEGLFPGRVIRAPLTASDRAQGFTGGIVTSVDTSFLSAGASVIDSIDAKGRWRIALGEIRATARFAVTWQPRFSRRRVPTLGADTFSNRLNGALRWNGTGGLTLERANDSLDLSFRYIGGYEAVRAPLADTFGQAHVTPQLNFDLAYERAFKLGEGRRLKLQFVIQDIFDRGAARVRVSDEGYSLYADPRGRRASARVGIEF